MFSLLILTSFLIACIPFTLSIHSGFNPATTRSTVIKERSPLTVSPHVLSLSKRKSLSFRGHNLRSSIARKEATGTHIASLEPAGLGWTYFANITFGDQTFLARVDTGSSDTWVIADGFQCIGDNYTQISSTDCKFGPTYKISPTFTQLPNETFSASYVDGESILGIVGTEDVTLAGITVHKQEVGVVTTAMYNGDGYSSGLIGLAFPSMTSAYYGFDVSPSTNPTQQLYKPIFTNMYNKSLVASVFSFAIDRDTATGQLAIGGLPNVSASLPCAATPLQYRNKFGSGTTTAAVQYTYYVIKAGFTFKGWVGNVTNECLATVDSGTTLLWVPASVAQAVNSQFVPPAVNESSGIGYTVNCNASAPSFGVVINGQTFWINPADLIESRGEGLSCWSGIQAAADDEFSLGDVFFKNVLAVFDVGAGKMYFANRMAEQGSKDGFAGPGYACLQGLISAN